MRTAILIGDEMNYLHLIRYGSTPEDVSLLKELTR